MKTELLRFADLQPVQLAAWQEMQGEQEMLRSPYFCPDYSRHVASVRDDARILMVSEADQPVAFLPLQVGRFGQARPMGGPLSDYQGMITRPGTALDPREILQQAGLTLWQFDHLLAEQAAFEPHHAVRSESPIIELPDTLEQWLAERKQAGSKVGEQTLRRGRKAEREVGPLRFVDHVCDRAVFDQVCAWKSAQYERTGLVDVLSFGWTRDLLWNIVQDQRDAFAGTLSALYLGERLVAGHIGMRSQRVWHWWFPAYDAELSAYSPGTLLLLEMMRVASEQGLREIDLGKGDAQYKQRFHTAVVPLAEGAVQVPSLATSARNGLHKAVGWLRGLPLPGFMRAPGKLVRRLLRRDALR